MSGAPAYLSGDATPETVLADAGKAVVVNEAGDGFDLSPSDLEARLVAIEGRLTALEAP